MTPFKIKAFFFFLLVASLFLLIIWQYISCVKNETLIRTATLFPIYLNADLPPINLTDKDGKTITSRDINSGTYILHFWATWCKSCEKELFSISKSGIKDKKIMCISVDEEPEKAVRFLQERGLDIPLYFDIKGESATIMGSNKFPETYIVNNGKIILKFEGPRDWEDKSLVDLINEATKN